MKNSLRVISVLVSCMLIFSLCACDPIISDTSSTEVEIQYTTEYIGDENITSSDNTNTQVSSVDGVVGNTSNVQNSQIPSGDNSSVPSQESSSQEIDPNTSEKPRVTICAAVARGVYAVGGVCPIDTDYILVEGPSISATKIVPAKGKSESYFLGQIKISETVGLEIQCKQSGKEISKKVILYAYYNANQKDMQTTSDYKVTFGSESRMHFYSALLSYSLSNVVTDDIRALAETNIGNTVQAAKKVGAEVIYLVVPSSAAVYPETVPSEYKAASGESIYQAFNNIATKCGAKVIYPIDTMKAHKNDGDGYKIYSHTDSHWTTYGAYWGVYELMNYIGEKHPSAKPRTVAEMGFYTTELYGGDALFSFDDNNGFENFSTAASSGGKTSRTEIKELTTLYNLKMPTDTLSKITRGKKSIYLTKDNEEAYNFTNSNGAGLPTAVVVRDSFGRTAYDIINDRFSAVAWLAEGDYTGVLERTAEAKPDYVVYIVSERNLLKVMFNNKDIQLRSFA